MQARAPRPLVPVVAAALFDAAGHVLIAQRPAGKALAGRWEFPGGKVAAGESERHALRRELREELGIEVEVGALVESLTHAYPEKTVHLRFYRCRWLRHEPQPLGCSGLKWLNPDELAQHEFPAADARLLQLLRQNPSLWQE